MLRQLLLLLRGLIRAVFRTLFALAILFEEWGWAPLLRAMAALGRLPLLRQIEACIARLRPYPALLVFLLPSLLLIPVKLLALWLIGRGEALLGLAVIVVAKLLGTAVLARLFHLTEPALQSLPWFARLYARWAAWKEGLLAWVRASPVWCWSRALKLRLRRAWRART